MRFEVLDLSLDLVRSLRRPLGIILGHDPELARQIRKASSSVPLNIAEGSRRRGRDRRHLWRVAAGSADEARTALRVAEVWGYVDDRSISEPLAVLDRVLAILWTLTH